MQEFWRVLKSFELKLYHLIFCYVCLSKLYFSIIRLPEGLLHIPIYIIFFRYNLKNSLSALYHRSCLSVDLLHCFDDGDWCWNGRSNQSCFLHIFLSRKCLLVLCLLVLYQYEKLFEPVIFLEKVSFSVSYRLL